MALSVPQAARGSHVFMCCARAAEFGIRPGMPVAEALALHSGLHVEEVQPDRDLYGLRRLAEWMDRFSPVVGLEEGENPQSLLVDITGCGACFGGENLLVERAARDLRIQGWSVRIAVADTIGAAWAQARFSGSCLDAMPLAALRLPAEAIQVLKELGIERVRGLAELPRESLPARFGTLLLLRLDQAFGRIAEAMHPHRPAPEICAIHAFEYATERLETLNAAIGQLAEQIHRELQNRNLGARRIMCWIYHETAEPCRLEATLCRPSRNARHMRELLCTRLEHLRLAEPVTALALRILESEPLSDTQTVWFGAEGVDEENALADLIDRLSVRLGRDAVTRPVLVPDPQPEYAYRFEPVIGGAERGRRAAIGKRRRRTLLSLDFAESEVSLPTRPLKVWPRPLAVEVMSVVPEGPPIQFHWSGQDYRIIRTWGPERIETGWWRDLDVSRDYYTVATHTGARFWLFRKDDGRWFLHGCYE